MPDYSLSIDDGGPPWVVTLGDADDDSFSLLGGFPEMAVRPVDGGNDVVISGANVSILSETQVLYNPDPADWETLGPGLYLVRWKITLPGEPGPTTFPSPSPQVIEVVA